MEANKQEVTVVIEGFEEIYERDLNKHRAIVEKTKVELAEYKKAQSYQVQKKRKYKTIMKGKNNYDEESMKRAIDLINIDIRHYSDRIDAAQQKLEFNNNIVSTLQEQLNNQYKGLKMLAEERKKEIDGLTDRLEQQTD